uniref:Protein kinase domain-containing protein n=1 Tax=Macrostomum lignano TaxID=282301 RepID=A0A1I8HLF3_9PLAT
MPSKRPLRRMLFRQRSRGASLATKSLDKLEFSLNNMMLGLSLAPRNQRRLAEADRFLTDLVDSIRANRTSRRPRRRPDQAKTSAQQANALQTPMRRKLENESRALWRAQHIGARCEDTVDRYMLDVVMDRLGEMAAQSGTCGRCGGIVTSIKKSSEGEGELSGEGYDENADNDYSGNRHNSCSMLSFGASGASGGISFPKRLPNSLGLDDANNADSQEQPKHNSQLHQHRNVRDNITDMEASQDQWTLRTWQPTAAQSSGTNNNNCCQRTVPAAVPAADPDATLQTPAPNNTSSDSRRVTTLAASVAAYRRGSLRYAKALRVAAYLRDLCREFYRTGCGGRAPPVAHDLEWVLSSLTELVTMRDRAVALAVRCTGCPALCPAERLSSPQLCRLRRLLKLACTKGDCKSGSGGLLDLVDALADSDNRPDRCRLLRQLREVAAYSDGPDANYRRLINAMAGQTELANCASNYAAHQRRMCGTAPPVVPGPRGLTRADMRALAIDLAPIEAAASAPCQQRRRRRRPLRRSAAAASPLTKALHNPAEMRRRLRMHQFATGASLAVKAEVGACVQLQRADGPLEPQGLGLVHQSDAQDARLQHVASANFEHELLVEVGIPGARDLLGSFHLFAFQLRMPQAQAHKGGLEVRLLGATLGDEDALAFDDAHGERHVLGGVVQRQADVAWPAFVAWQAAAQRLREVGCPPENLVQTFAQATSDFFFTGKTQEKLNTGFPLLRTVFDVFGFVPRVLPAASSFSLIMLTTTLPDRVSRPCCLPRLIGPSKRDALMLHRRLHRCPVGSTVFTGGAAADAAGTQLPTDQLKTAAHILVSGQLQLILHQAHPFRSSAFGAATSSLRRLRSADSAAPAKPGAQTGSQKSLAQLPVFVDLVLCDSALTKISECRCKASTKTQRSELVHEVPASSKAERGEQVHMAVSSEANDRPKPANPMPSRMRSAAAHLNPLRAGRHLHRCRLDEAFAKVGPAAAAGTAAVVNVIAVKLGWPSLPDASVGAQPAGAPMAQDVVQIVGARRRDPGAGLRARPADGDIELGRAARPGGRDGFVPLGSASNRELGHSATADQPLQQQSLALRAVGDAGPAHLQFKDFLILRFAFGQVGNRFDDGRLAVAAVDSRGGRPGWALAPGRRGAVAAEEAGRAGRCHFGAASERRPAEEAVEAAGAVGEVVGAPVVEASLQQRHLAGGFDVAQFVDDLKDCISCICVGCGLNHSKDTPDASNPAQNATVSLRP